MPYIQNTESCFADAVGAGGVARADYDAALGDTAAVLGWLRGAYEDESRPFLRLPEKSDDLPVLAKIADDHAARFETVVILGTGGSSLGGRAIAALADNGFGPRPGRPRLVFMENVDPATLADLFAGLDASRTGLIAVSKSGATAETLAQLLVCLDAWSERAPKEYLTAVAEPGDSPLRALAANLEVPVLDHDPDIGGRYAALSVTGALPALLAGLDARALREGAATVLRATLDAPSPAAAAPAVGAALNLALMRGRGVSTAVFMPYADRLLPFAFWFRQLWAESLGKDGHGATPAQALGTVDQHSQLQLYLGGPNDKFYTLILLDQAGLGPRINTAPADDDRLDYLAGRTIGDLMEAEQRATAETLAAHGRPVRVMRLARLDEAALGAMMMHFMLETVITGRVLGVDPFDQPAVEAGKVLTRKYLAEMGPGEKPKP